ncbi:hypothetical protein Tco_0229207, partial [Tanacetum coccineum]
MWIAIERLQQGESLNVQDIKTNLFWEFGKFTSRDGEFGKFTSRDGESKAAEQADWLEDTDEEIDDRNWKHITATWQRFMKSHMKNPVLLKDDSNVTLDSSNIYTNDNQVDQNAVECVDERNSLANLTLDTEENKTIL